MIWVLNQAINSRDSRDQGVPQNEPVPLGVTRVAVALGHGQALAHSSSLLSASHANLVEGAYSSCVA
jgi:hypothetical protein